jgi:hypothetical protein
VRALFGADRFGPKRDHGVFQLPVPAGWHSRTAAPWTHHEPTNTELPQQGWKIHVSTTAPHARQLLILVSDICIASRTAFKHLSSAGELRAANSKYADRGSAGKFITIYPHSDEAFDALVRSLDEQLAGLPGPYILSDVRHGRGPVFARYGAFEEMRSISDSGQEILCIQRPDGSLVEDRRDPELHVPDFVTVPASISSQVSERLNPSDDGLTELLGDLTAETALHFSNGGGVYQLQSADGSDHYVMKEGRRHAAWDMRGVDAFDRVVAEYANLKVLAPTGVTPAPMSLKVVEDHAFLIEEHIQGMSLYSWVATEYPFSYEFPVEAYQRRALHVLEKLTTAVDAVHRRGMAVMDLHPFNVIMTPEGEVRLIDLESSCPLSVPDASIYVGTPGYMPKGPHTPSDRDAYALLQLALGLFYPISSVSAISDDVIRVLIANVQSLFTEEVRTVIGGLYAAVEHLLEPGLRAGRPLDDDVMTAMSSLSTELAEGIRQSRDHRETARNAYPLSDAMPGSVAELALESGLAGVMLALGPSDSESARDLSKLATAARKCRTVGAGLLSGVTGVAALLAARGERDAACELFQRRQPLPGGDRNLSLRNGMAGETIGALLIAKYTGSTEMTSEAERWTGLLLATIEHPPAEVARAGSTTENPLGLVHGWSGVALALSAAARAFDKPELHEAARSAIALDLQNMITAPDGSLQGNDGHRMMPYVADGSAGLGLALSEIPARYRREGDDDILRSVYAACRARVSVSGGLFHGRLGLLLTMTVVGRHVGLEPQGMLHEQLPLLKPFLFSVEGEGEGARYVTADDNRRLSLDLAQGASGWLVALRAMGLALDASPSAESLLDSIVGLRPTKPSPSQVPR